MVMDLAACVHYVSGREVTSNDIIGRAKGKSGYYQRLEPIFASFDYAYPGKLHKGRQVFLLRV